MTEDSFYISRGGGEGAYLCMFVGHPKYCPVSPHRQAKATSASLLNDETALLLASLSSSASASGMEGPPPLPSHLWSDVNAEASEGEPNNSH